MLNELQTGRTAPKCRVQHCIVCGPAALIAEAIFQHAQVAGIPPPKLHIAVDDVSAGYNNLPTDREYVMCAWDDEVKAARF